MKKNFTKLFSVGLLCLSLYAFGQQKPITGKVTDSSGFPVQDAYVYVEGQENGVYTDENGNYTIEAQPGDKIMVEFIGFDTKNIPVKENTSNYNVKLEKGGEVKLRPVITTGYTNVSDDAYTGSADIVDATDIEGKNTSNITNALAGESAGVRVINSSGQPGSVGEINIRGLGSIEGNREPLYIVDGVPFSGSINSINPNDIVSLVILKDATATAPYGARGANGVVVINTRKGRVGKSIIEYQGKVGINDRWIPNYDVITSPETFTELAWRSLNGFASVNGVKDPGLWASNNLFGGNYGFNEQYLMWDKAGTDLIDPKTGKVLSGVKRKYTPENWLKEAFKPGMRFEHNLKFSGGFDKTTFYASLGYLKDVGNAINSNYERYSTRLNVTHQLNNWLSGSLNLGYSYSEMNNNGQTGDSNSVFYFSNNIPPIFPIYLRDGNGNKIPNKILGGYLYDFGEDRGFSLGTNAVGQAVYDYKNTRNHDVNVNTSVNVKFTDYLSLENRFGAQFGLSLRDQITNPFYGASAGSNGTVSKRKNDDLSYDFLQMLKFNKNFNNHSINAFVAHEANWYRYNYMGGYRSNLLDANLPEWNNAAVFGGMNSYTLSYAIESYFGQLEYGYDKKYLLSASIRRDGSSRFLNEKWGTFGAVGAGWVVSREHFMENQKIFDHLKLKASYGLTGEQAGLGYYPGYNLFDVGTINAKFLSFFPSTLGNPNLTWEKAKMFQTGVEMRMFNNRLSLNVDYYRKLTDDMLFEKRIAPSTGNAIFKVNDGTLRNSGVEFDLGAKLVNKEDFKFSFNVNGEILSNEITKMPINDKTRKQIVFDRAGIYGRSVGHSIYDFYTREWAGVDKSNGRAQWYLYYNDVNNNNTLDDGEAIKDMALAVAKNPNMNIKKTITNKIATATFTYIGKSAIPKVRGAFNLRAEYKNWNVSAQFLYSLGGYAYDGSYATLMHNDKIGSNNWHKDMLNSWTPENPNSDIPRLTNEYDGQGDVNSTSSRFLTKSDYLALNNVSLRYSFSDRVLNQINLKGLSLSVSGDNLMLFSARKGFNPMTSTTGSSSSYTYDPLSTVTLGINIKF